MTILEASNPKFSPLRGSSSNVYRRCASKKTPLKEQIHYGSKKKRSATGHHRTLRPVRPLTKLSAAYPVALG